MMQGLPYHVRPVSVSSEALESNTLASSSTSVLLPAQPMLMQEQQHLQHCLVHALNGLLQRRVLSSARLDQLADAMTAPTLSGLWSPHR